MCVNNYAEQIKRSVTMRQVCEMYGIDIDRKGFVRCPFHAGDNSPSMKIYPGNRGYHCFACNRSGDSIQFVMDFFGLSFADALAKLNSDFSLGLDLYGKLDRKAQMEASKKSALMKRKKIAEEIEHRRLINDYETALDKFTVYDEKCRDCALKCEIDGITEEEVEALKNVAQSKYDLDLAESRLFVYEHRNRSNSTI